MTCPPDRASGRPGRAGGRPATPGTPSERHGPPIVVQHAGRAGGDRSSPVGVGEAARPSVSTIRPSLWGLCDEKGLFPYHLSIDMLPIRRL